MNREPNSADEIFKVKGDGTIERLSSTLPQNNDRYELDKELLDIIEVNSYSKSMLSAFRAKQIANKICKKKYGRGNYREYVEMLMVKNFPAELDKARLGRKYLIGIWLSMICTVICTVMFLMFISYYSYYIENYNDSYIEEMRFYFLSALSFGIISGLIIWKMVIPAYKKLKKMYQ